MPTPRPFVDDKQLTGWNALQGLALLALDRAKATADGRSTHRQRAIHISNQLWSRFDPGSGHLARDQYGIAAAGAEDFAYLAALQLEIYDHDPDAVWLDRARILLDLALDNGHVGPHNAADWHDAELPAPALVLCRTADGLLARAYSETSLRRTQHCRSLLREPASESSPLPWLLQETATADWLTRVHYFADGHGRAVIRPVKNGDGNSFTIDLSLDAGWHINAAQIKHPRLTPTLLRFDEPAHEKISYPTGETFQPDFSAEPLLLYQGEVRIRVDVAARQRGTLTVQACSDRICLLPEHLKLDFW
jgi:hypothetical protein